MKKISLILSFFAFMLYTNLSMAQSDELLASNDNSNNEYKIESKIKWISLEDAEQLSQKHKKPIFIDTYTSWCHWCKVMDKKTFSQAEVINYVNKNYYAVKLDADSYAKIKFKGKTTTNRNLVRSTFKVTGYPTIVMISPSGKISAQAGYRPPASFLTMLRNFKMNNK